MRAREADARLEMIRSLMQRGSRWPGLSAGACFAAGGLAAVTSWWCNSRGLDFKGTLVSEYDSTSPYGTSAVPWWCTLAVGCFFGFVASTAAGAVRRGEPPISRQTWAALLSIAPALFAGTFLTAARPRPRLHAVWLLC
ncbi:MAG: hypothetical protein K8T20_14270, partial [Planctomycetes bacterium]|nr:hypothetical protein [Planctomycetota bacterium]